MGTFGIGSGTGDCSTSNHVTCLSITVRVGTLKGTQEDEISVSSLHRQLGTLKAEEFLNFVVAFFTCVSLWYLHLVDTGKSQMNA